MITSARHYHYQGESIGMRPLTELDISDSYLSWFSDKDVCKYNSHGIYPKTRREQEEYVKSLYQNKTKIVWAIDDLENQRHIGNVSLSAIDFVNRNAELGILIGEKSVWGRGFSKEAVRFVLDHGFNKLNLHRIYCGTAATNVSMQKLAKTVGMLEEGRLKDGLFLEGSYVDVLLYGITK